MSLEKVFFHVDLDAFFASVEQLDHPEYRNRPVVVGGKPGDRRCVVSTASYEARKFGIHSAMPLATAVRLCPNAIFIRGNYKRYQEKSLQVMEIFSFYSPDVIQISIDEAFLDMTGTERLFGKSEDVAKRLKNEILEKTGLTVSVGIASTMYCAKIASGLQKPDGLTCVPFGKENDFMLSLPLEKVWGIGEKTRTRLKNAGLKTTKDIYAKSLKSLQSIFGESAGAFLYNAVRGNREITFGEEAKNHSLSSETTFDFDLIDQYAVESALMELCRYVMFRMHREKVRSHTVCLKIRFEDFTTISAQNTSDRAISSEEDLFFRIQKLLEKKWDKKRGIRLLGVAVENVEKLEIPEQKELFEFGDEKLSKLEKTLYEMEDKNPLLKVRRARLLEK